MSQYWIYLIGISDSCWDSIWFHFDWENNISHMDSCKSSCL